jgi:hypothetical protein
MVVGRLESRWVSVLNYRQYNVNGIGIDKDTVVPVPPGNRDRSLGLDRAIRESLQVFVADIAGSVWWGKEREALSLFAFSHLIHRCSPETALFDPGQIGLEVRVVQNPAKTGLRKALGDQGLSDLAEAKDERMVRRRGARQLAAGHHGVEGPPRS